MGAVLGRPAMPLAVLAALFSSYGNTPRLEPPQYTSASYQPSFWPTLPPAPAHSYGANIQNVTSQEVMVAASGAGVDGGNVTRVLSPHAAFFVQAALFVLARLAADFPLIAYTERAHALVALVALAVHYFPGITFSLIQDGIVQLLLAIGIAVCLLRRDWAATHRVHRYKHDEAKATNALSKVRKDNAALAQQNEALQAQCLKLLEAKEEHERQITGNLEEIGTLKGNLTAERKKHLNTHNALRAWEARRVEIEDKMRLAELAEGSLETLRKKKRAILDEIDALRKEHTRVDRTERLGKQLEHATEALERANSTTHESAQKEEHVADVKELSKRLTVAYEDEKQATKKVIDLQGKQDAGTKTDDQTAFKPISTTTASPSPSTSSPGQEEPEIDPLSLPVPEIAPLANIGPLPSLTRETISSSNEPSSNKGLSSTNEQHGEYQVSDVSAHHSHRHLASPPPANKPLITTPNLAEILETLKAGKTLDELEASPVNTTSAQDGLPGDVEAMAPLIGMENAAQPSAIGEETGVLVSPMHYELRRSKTSPKTPARTSRAASDSASSLRIAVLKNSQTMTDFQTLFFTPLNSNASAQGVTGPEYASSLTSVRPSSPSTTENGPSSSVHTLPGSSSGGDGPSVQTAAGAVSSTIAPLPSTPAPEQLNSSASASLPPTKADASVLSPSRLPGLDPTMWALKSSKKEPAQPGLCFYRPHMKGFMRKGVVRKGQTFPCDRKDCVGDPSKYDQSTGKFTNSGDPKAWLYGGSSEEDESARRFTAWDLKLCFECYVEELSRSEVNGREKEADKRDVDDDQDVDADFDEEAYRKVTQAGEEVPRGEQAEDTDKPQADQDQVVDDDFDEEVYGSETKTGEEVTIEQEDGEQEEQEPAEDSDGDAFEAALYAEFAEQDADKEKTAPEKVKMETEKVEEAADDGTNMATVDGFTMKGLVDATDLTGVETDSSPPTVTSPRLPDLSVYQDPTMTFDQAMEKASNKSRRHGPYDTCGG